MVEGLRAATSGVTLNLKSEEGLALLLGPGLPKFDVLMESFVPGTLEPHGTRARCPAFAASPEAR